MKNNTDSCLALGFTGHNSQRGLDHFTEISCFSGTRNQKETNMPKTLLLLS